MPHYIIFTHVGNPLVRFFFFRQIKTITVQYLNANKNEKYRELSQENQEPINKSRVKEQDPEARFKEMQLPYAKIFSAARSHHRECLPAQDKTLWGCLFALHLVSHIEQKVNHAGLQMVRCQYLNTLVSGKVGYVRKTKDTSCVCSVLKIATSSNYRDFHHAEHAGLGWVRQTCQPPENAPQEWLFTQVGKPPAHPRPGLTSVRTHCHSIAETLCY